MILVATIVLPLSKHTFCIWLRDTVDAPEFTIILLSAPFWILIVLLVKVVELGVEIR